MIVYGGLNRVVGMGCMDEIIRSDAIGWSCGFRLMNNTPIRTRPGRVPSHQLASE